MIESFMFCSGGPAFIAARGLGSAWWDGSRLDIEWPGDDEDYWREQFGVPVDYVWQPATECTMAGWVRRKNPAIPEAGREPNSGSLKKRVKSDS